MSKPDGWFSRRHRTDEAAKAAKARREESGTNRFSPPKHNPPTGPRRPDGRATVERVFKSSKIGNIAALIVRQGTLRRDDLVVVRRNGTAITSRCQIESLRRFKEDVTEVRTLFECGVKLMGFDAFKEGDELIVWPRDHAARLRGGA